MINHIIVIIINKHLNYWIDEKKKINNKINKIVDRKTIIIRTQILIAEIEINYNYFYCRQIDFIIDFFKKSIQHFYQHHVC